MFYFFFLDFLFWLAFLSFTHSFMKVKMQMKMRKLIGVDALLDYHDPVANPAHEPPPPKKGSTGGKGGNNR